MKLFYLSPLVSSSNQFLRYGSFRAWAGREKSCPYEVLGVRKDVTRGEARSAYVKRMKEVHPDVTVEDTTEIAAKINEAYEQILLQISSEGDISWNLRDVFDDPREAPEYVFVNPFRCFNVNPLDWRALQALVIESTTPSDALLAARVSHSDSAICYLTNDQKQIIEEELTRLTETLDFETCQWFIEDCLIRAQQANAKVM